MAPVVSLFKLNALTSSYFSIVGRLVKDPDSSFRDRKGRYFKIAATITLYLSIRYLT